MPAIPKVYFSYAWGDGESPDGKLREEAADYLYAALKERERRREVEVVIDRERMSYKSSIRKFTEAYGHAEALIILIISEKYLQSEYCMGEVVQVLSNRDYRDRIFPVVLPDAGLRDPLRLVRYHLHWEKRKNQLAEAIDQIGDKAHAVRLVELLQDMAEITRIISSFTTEIRDTITVSPPDYQPLLMALDRQLEAKSFSWRSPVPKSAIFFRRPTERESAYEPQEADSFTNKLTRAGRINVSGKLLYQLPDKMIMGKEYRCIIRVAEVLDILQKNMETNIKSVVKDVRISEIMSVELRDIAENKAFEVTQINKQVQLVLPDEYTEWQFIVKPLRDGRHSLFLVVAVVYNMDNTERTREIVHEEKIEVISSIDGMGIIEVGKSDDARIVHKDIAEINPLHILFTAATPQHAGQINVGYETRFKDLIREFDRKDKIQFKEEHGLSQERFRNYLFTNDPHIVHFAGHGETEGLVLQDRSLDASVLLSLVKLQHNTQVVLLNACNTLPMAKELAAYIPYVIGTPGPLSDDAAISFARGFYTGIATGRSVEDSYRYAVNSIEADGHGGGYLPVLVRRISSIAGTLDLPATIPKKVFLSYARPLLNEAEKLRTHLAVQRRNGKIEFWYDQAMVVGDTWDETIKAKIEEADIFILLLSADFWASDYIHEHELPLIEKRYEAGAKVMCVMVSANDFEETNWKRLQASPRLQGRLTPIQNWNNMDDAWKAVVDDLKKLIQ